MMPIAYLCFAVTALASSLGQVSERGFSEIWDDALFFKRIAHNIIHHGFAGWNHADGPVFANTSQLYQLISAGLYALAPDHYNAAAIFWGAACVVLSLGALARWAGRGGPSDAPARSLLLYGMMQAPPVFLAMTTGMETATAFLVIAAWLAVLLHDRLGRHVAALVLLQILVYLVRPDALLMTLLATLGVHGARGRDGLISGAKIAAGTLAALSLVSLVFHRYYGTALPLSFFLKTSQLSVYDRDYLALGAADKLRNLTQIAVVVLPLLPIVAARRDRVNIALCAAALAFIGYHALTTSEIMGYHARFYAPALPVLFAAALRSIDHPVSPWRPRPIAAAAVLAFGLWLVAYLRGWVENTGGFALSHTRAVHYAIYLVAVSAAGLLSTARGAGIAKRAVPAALFALCAVQVVATAPVPLAVTSDAASNARNIATYRSSVGIDVIQRCFDQPFQLMHSELGIPGVLFLESRVIDYTGLVNPSVVDRRFDFERTCAGDRPEFIFRPHWTHKRINDELSASACLAQGYTEVKLPRPSSCPLFVRNDLVQRYEACAAR